MKERSPQQPWTDEQRATLERMHGEHWSWPEIATACRHTLRSCQVTLSRIKRDRLVGEGVKLKRGDRKLWTDDELATMIRMREKELKAWPEIDAALNRAPGSCASKYSIARAPQTGSRLDGEARQALRDRDARKQLEHPTLTAAFFGDPLPGRSALDQKRGTSP